MGQYQPKEINIEEVWEEENRMSEDERRQRYRCRSFKTAKELGEHRWDNAGEYDEAIRRGDLTSMARQEYIDKEYNTEKLKLFKEHPVLKEEGFELIKGNEELNKKALKEVRDTLTKDIKKIEDAQSSGYDLSPMNKYVGNKDINSKVVLMRGDICTLEIDAIVNAANKTLMGGGGIDGAIHSAAGNKLDDECHTLQGCATGETKITRGYNLPAKFILHTVGPIGKDEPALVSCYTTILELCKKHKIRHVALCGISSGIYGYPLYAASHVACNTVRSWLEQPENANAIDYVVFCTYLENELLCYSRLMPLYFPPAGKKTEDIEAEYKKAKDQFDPSSIQHQLSEHIKKEMTSESEKLQRGIDHEVEFVKRLQFMQAQESKPEVKKEEEEE